MGIFEFKISNKNGSQNQTNCSFRHFLDVSVPMKQLSSHVLRVENFRALYVMKAEGKSYFFLVLSLVFVPVFKTIICVYLVNVTRGITRIKFASV